jgi:VWFA-related protein
VNVIRVFATPLLLLPVFTGFVLGQGAPVVNHQGTTSTDQKAPDSAQDSSSITLKVQSNLVQIRVVVRDRNNRPVENLKRDDFEVYDRGKLQTISTFAVESRDTNGNAAIIQAPGTLAPATTVPKRFVALVFDDTDISLQQSSQIRNAAQLFVRGAAPTDRVGIYSTSGQVKQEFTSDADAIQRAISNVVPRPLGMTNERECPNVPYSMASRIENNQDQDALNNVIHETLICAFGGDPRKMRYAQSEAQAAIHQALRAGEAEVSSVCRHIQDALRRLAEMPGERIMILVSPGFLVSEQMSAESEIIEQANRWDIVINSLDARGLFVPQAGDDISKRPTGAPETSDYKSIDRLETETRQSAVLDDFAVGTGGTFFHNSNDLSGGLKMAGLPSTFYMLGFSPRDLKQDGHYHELKVRLTGRQNYSIQARRGYYAPLPMGPAEQEQQEIDNELHSTAEVGDLLVDFLVESLLQSNSGGVLLLQSRVAVSVVRFKKVQGKNSDVLRLVTAIFDMNGNFVTGGEKILTMNVDDATYQRLSESGLTVHLTFTLKPGRYMVRQVLRDSESGEMSARSRAVEIAY